MMTRNRHRELMRVIRSVMSGSAPWILYNREGIGKHFGYMVWQPRYNVVVSDGERCVRKPAERFGFSYRNDPVRELCMKKRMSAKRTIEVQQKRRT